MTFDIFAEVERDIRRILSEGERLPEDRRRRKRCARNALQEAKRTEMQAKGKYPTPKAKK
jgi:hypothetical protein